MIILVSLTCEFKAINDNTKLNFAIIVINSLSRCLIYTEYNATITLYMKFVIVALERYYYQSKR